MTTIKLLITGGAGFIGSNLVRYLLEDPRHQVLNLDKLCFPGSSHTVSDLNGKANYEFLQGDICDFKVMDGTMREFRPDAIIHLAAESHVDRSIDSPQPFIESNIRGTFNLLEVFRRYYNVVSSDRRHGLRFIHVSTDEVYGSLGENDHAVTETQRYNPSSPYAASKAASDHLVRAWHLTYSLPLIITNCSNNYGPYQFPEKLIPLVINKALAGEKIPVYGKGINVRDWLYVEDHVKALSLVLGKGKPGQTYNIGGDNERTNLSVVHGICDLLDELRPAKKSYREQVEFVEDRPGHDLRYAINSSRIRTELDWRPEENFDGGLRRTVRWYIDNQEWCSKVCNTSYGGQRLGLGIS